MAGWLRMPGSTLVEMLGRIHVLYFVDFGDATKATQEDTALVERRFSTSAVSRRVGS